MSELLPCSELAKTFGVLSVHGLTLKTGNKIVYVVVDPVKMNHEFIKKQANTFWILTKYSKDNATNEIIPKTS